MRALVITHGNLQGRLSAYKAAPGDAGAWTALRQQIDSNEPVASNIRARSQGIQASPNIADVRSAAAAISAGLQNQNALLLSSLDFVSQGQAELAQAPVAAAATYSSALQQLDTALAALPNPPSTATTAARDYIAAIERTAVEANATVVTQVRK